jgi:hypothetical protein
VENPAVDDAAPRFPILAAKTIVVHSVTYFLCGVLAFYFLDYADKFAQPGTREVMRQTSDPIVMAGPLFQPIRGLLFAIAFYPIRSALFGRKHGWLATWLVLMIVGILNTFGPRPGSVEGMVYTTTPILSQLWGLSEVVSQSLLLSIILCYWVNHPEKRWLNWVLGVAFVLTIALPLLGLLVGRPS